MQNGKNYHKHSDSKPQTQLAIEKFADMMIARMEEMKESHWKKGWIDGTGGYGLPQNIASGTLNGGNSFFLQLDTAMNGYKMPLYMTFLQAQNMGLRINKGAESMPVIFWDMLYKDQNGKKVDRSDIDMMHSHQRPSSVYIRSSMSIRRILQRSILRNMRSFRSVSRLPNCVMTRECTSMQPLTACFSVRNGSAQCSLSRWLLVHPSLPRKTASSFR